jgi:hypothetical protein
VAVRRPTKIIAHLERISERLGSEPMKVRVGFLEGATYPDGTSVALVAAVQDMGSPAQNIPPRPFFRNVVAAKSGEWPNALRAALAATDDDAEKALGIVGEGIAGQLRQSIVDTNEPPLAPATIARKGFDKPLVDTGHMLQSVDKEVVGG